MGFLAIATQGMLALLFIRNVATLAFMWNMGDRVSACCHADIDNGHDWRWRYDALNSVSYNKVLFHFWKPLRPESFWFDTSFLEDKWNS